jgi:hypothetical protein
MANVGDSSAPSSNTVYYDALLSTTLNNYSKTMYDNIFKDSALLAYLRMSDAIQRQDGGERAQLPLMYGDNGTVATHAGYEEIDTTPQDGITSAFYEWAEIAGSITISRKELRQNSGEGRLLDLLKAKTKQAEMTMSEYLNKSIVQGTVSSSTFIPNQSRGGVNGVNPIPYLIRLAPATNPTDSVGNINSATYDWWRTRVADLSSGSTPTGGQFGLNVTTYAGLKVGLRRMYNYCSRGTGGSPDLCLIDQVGFETYENALDTQVRYQNTKMADMGFDTIKLRGATMVWDELVPDLENGTTAITTGTAFFINTDFMKLMIDKETDMVTTPFVEPIGQTAKTAKILFMGQLCSSNQRKHGACFGISQSIVA